MKSALVTGASKGIGEATAIHLAARGWRVYAGFRSAADGQRLATIGNVEPVRLDVTEAKDIANLVRRLASDLDGTGLDAVVDNAGIAVAGPLEYVPIERLRTQLEINVIGQVAVTQAVLPLLRVARGRIVLVGSVAGRSSMPLVGPYSASKHALEAIADAWRVELRPAGIFVSIIEPGVIATPIWETSIESGLKSLEDAPAELDERYGAALRAVQKWAAEGTGGLPADAVARVIERALTAARPRARYVVGRDARMRMLLEWLPDRWRDALISRALRRL